MDDKEEKNNEKERKERKKILLRNEKQSKRDISNKEIKTDKTRIDRRQKRREKI